jgi:hypothetical protein
LYYGIKFSTEEASYNYKSHSDIMESIKISIECCIWFSKELSLQLTTILEKESKKIIFGRPRIVSIDYSRVDEKYMPNDADYDAWRENSKKP